jgi:DNA-binding NarL/FixJ family response regulator
LNGRQDLVCGAETEDGFDAIGKAKKTVARSDCFGPAHAGDGLEAARELNRLFPQIPLMMLTSYHSSAAEREARASGIAAVFSKPEGMQNLIWHARAVLMAS